MTATLDRAAEHEAPATQQLWILDIHSFMLAGLLVSMGGRADLIGLVGSLPRSSSPNCSPTRRTKAPDTVRGLLMLCARGELNCRGWLDVPQR